MVRSEGYHFNEKAELKENVETNGNRSFVLKNKFNDHES